MFHGNKNISYLLGTQPALIVLNPVGFPAKALVPHLSGGRHVQPLCDDDDDDDDDELVIMVRKKKGGINLTQIKF